MDNFFRLIVQYNGTNYHGFQRQKHCRTVQEELEKALSIILREKIMIKAASRTDRGVHALGQVVTFNSSCSDLKEDFLYHLNAVLPKDIRVVKVGKTNQFFHPRRDAVMRHYSYLINNSPYSSPFLDDLTYHCPFPLDLERMRSVAQLFLGEHDFKSFTTSEETRPTIRSFKKIEIKKEDNLIEINFSGLSFLYNMLRMVGAALVQVGLKRTTQQEIALCLNLKKKPSFAPLPAKGLFLVKIDYPDGFTDNVFQGKGIPFPSALLS